MFKLAIIANIITDKLVNEHAVLPKSGKQKLCDFKKIIISDVFVWLNPLRFNYCNERISARTTFPFHSPPKIK